MKLTKTNCVRLTDEEVGLIEGVRFVIDDLWQLLSDNHNGYENKDYDMIDKNTLIDLSNGMHALYEVVYTARIKFSDEDA